ncbi:MAG TPA: helix-turn-helix domain-containing protein [Candidatus Brachybacterium merdavium]|uniref:Helix-turn-helix domain-containing protein n=1 Tax=Candidatus Brachybacterium merdavium TaxID=2838513 RepID=A0A9D2RPT8_9MICO|nr:helix-turn-helix domain-containing protein [Candidatus Brachybacterium merdavium]
MKTDDPIAQVADACGYREVRAFITAFRRHYGQPPGSFRDHGAALDL